MHPKGNKKKTATGLPCTVYIFIYSQKKGIAWIGTYEGN